MIADRQAQRIVPQPSERVELHAPSRRYRFGGVECRRERVISCAKVNSDRQVIVRTRREVSRDRIISRPSVDADVLDATKGLRFAAITCDLDRIARLCDVDSIVHPVAQNGQKRACLRDGTIGAEASFQGLKSQRIAPPPRLGWWERFRREERTHDFGEKRGHDRDSALRCAAWLIATSAPGREESAMTPYEFLDFWKNRAKLEE